LSNLKAIRRRITSVKNTKQITRAMKLVSAAKLRRAQDAALEGRAFSSKLSHTLEMVRVDLPEGASHALLEPREVKKRRIIAITGDRGLCGAFNVNIYKAIHAADFEQGAILEFIPVGRKIAAICKAHEWPVLRSYEGLGEDIRQWPLAELAQSTIGAFVAGECDEVVLYYTKFETMVTQSVTREVLLPLTIEKESSALEPRVPGMTLYDPPPADILSYLLPLLVSTKLRQAALDSKASEHAARMRAMDAATRNANELIDKLTLHYNRARQRAITTELIDIVGGAEALK
jgi:F-type H+-transporting ATPase subunit gamma